MTLEIQVEKKTNNFYFFFPRERENHDDVVEGLFYEESKFIVKHIGYGMETPLDSMELIIYNKVNRGKMRSGRG